MVIAIPQEFAIAIRMIIIIQVAKIRGLFMISRNERSESSILPFEQSVDVQSTY